MNQDSSHDPLPFDVPSQDHFPPGSHFLPSADFLGSHHSGDFDILSSQHSAPLSPFDQGANTNGAHQQVLGSQVIGEPDSGGVWHQQQTPFTCAVVSQEMILREYGLDVNEAHLMGDAMQNGWLNAGGTPFQDMGKLLELHGVPCHEGQGIDQMISELSQGHKLIVGVDSTDLWYGDSWVVRELHDIFTGGPADHAIVVQGLRQDDGGGWHVIVNDPGNPNGEGHEYPLDQFTDAWEGSNCHFTATDIPPHGLASDPTYGSGFDEQTGTYTGVMDWLRHHSGALAMSAAFVARTSIASKPAKSEQERNDILREV